MKLRFVLAVVVVLAVPVPPQAGGTNPTAVHGSATSMAEYDGIGDDHDLVREAASSPDGRTLYVAGATGWRYGPPEDQNTAHTMLVVAYAARDLTEKWTALWQGPDMPGSTPQDTGAAAIVPSADGTRVYVAGTDYIFGRTVILALDSSDGHEVWRRSLDGEQSRYVNGLTEDVTGTRLFMVEHDSARGTVTTAVDAMTGTTLWSMVLAPGSWSHPSFTSADVLVDVSPDAQRVYVAGWGDNARGGLDLLLASYDVATGGLLWNKTRMATGAYEFPVSLVASSDGQKVLVGGTSHQGGRPRFLVESRDAQTGEVLWSRTWDDPSSRGA